MRNTFYISCPIDTYSGYGARSRDFVKAIIESEKYDVVIVPQRWGDTRKGFINDFKEWGFLNNYLMDNVNLHREKPDIWCQITVPNEFQAIGRYNIGLTAGIETTQCAASWIEGCNRMNLVLTSSTHSKNVLEVTKYKVVDKNNPEISTELKLTTPVEVLIEGVNLNVYKPLKTPMTSNKLYKHIDSIPENFAYLFVGHWLQGEMGEDRKNVGLMLKAFYEVFKNKSNAPALILKSSCGKGSHMDRREIMRRIDAIRKTIDAKIIPNVYLIHGDLSDAEINELYNHPKVKSMVSATKGEGFGRPLLEFALTGKPVIASGWSGQTDFLDSKHNILLGGTLTDIHASAQHPEMLVEGSKWFSVDHGQLGNALVDVKKNYKDWYKKGKIHKNILKKNFSYESMKSQIYEILDNNISNIPVAVKLTLPKLNLPKLQK